MSFLRRALFLFFLSVALAIPLVATAAREVVKDPNDTRGPLDIRLVRHWDKGYPRWTTYTWKKWRAAQIWDHGFVVIQFDTMGDEHFDYYAMVRSDGHRLIASLHRDYERKDDRRIAYLKLSRPERTAVRVRIPLDRMEFTRRAHYRWKARTLWSGHNCARVCIDLAPDSGAVVVPAPQPTPSPTITVTPTPTDL